MIKKENEQIKRQEEGGWIGIGIGITRPAERRKVLDVPEDIPTEAQAGIPFDVVMPIFASLCTRETIECSKADRAHDIFASADRGALNILLSGLLVGLRSNVSSIILVGAI